MKARNDLIRRVPYRERSERAEGAGLEGVQEASEEVAERSKLQMIRVRTDSAVGLERQVNREAGMRGLGD